MRRLGKAVLLGAPFLGFALHLLVSSRWAVIHFTWGNRKTIPLDLNEVLCFFVFIVALLAIGWLSRTLRQSHLRLLVIATGLNVVAFLFTASLMLTGIIAIVE